MKLTRLLWIIVGSLSLLYSDLESRQVFDGVVLPLTAGAFLIWGLVKLSLRRRGSFGGDAAGSGGFGGGDGGCGGDGGGC
jgi:hypothetical protein